MTFDRLEIPMLKKVNLIGGKNNSGKTSLLESIRIFASEGDNTVINNILANRGILKKGWSESYDALFYRDKSRIKKKIKINDIEIGKKDNGSFYSKKGISPYVLNAKSLNSETTSDNPKDKVVLVPYQSDSELLNNLWESIVLTPKEEDVFKILRETVEPKLVRVDVGNKTARVLLNDVKKPVSLGTLGDGVHRILLIALSLANAQNSILLIDEIELGLHYSAMEKLWQMIFKYAQEWNIQVFATTHSQDAIKTFDYVASDEKYINDAEYIRLQIGRTGKNEAIIFDGDRLKDSLELQLEIR